MVLFYNRSYYELSTDRYSVSKFDDKPLETEVIDKFLKRGIIAPTGCNYQPQMILVMSNEESFASHEDIEFVTLLIMGYPVPDAVPN